MFTLRQYLLALLDSRGLTRTLGEIDVCRDAQGRPCFSAGNSAAVFRIRIGGRIRSLRCYLRPMRHLKEIYGQRLLEKELYLHTSPETGVWVDTVVGDWIEGSTLHETVAQAAALRDRECLQILVRLFDRLALALVPDGRAAAAVFTAAVNNFCAPTTPENRALAAALETFANRPGSLDISSTPGRLYSLTEVLGALAAQNPGALFHAAAQPGAESLERQTARINAGQSPQP